MLAVKVYFAVMFFFVGVLLGLVIWQTIRELRGVSRAALEEKLEELAAAELKKKPVRSDERLADEHAARARNKRSMDSKPAKARAFADDDAPAPSLKRSAGSAELVKARTRLAALEAAADDETLVLSTDEREYREDIGMVTRGATRLDITGS